MDKRPWDSNAILYFSVIYGFPHKTVRPFSKFSCSSPSSLPYTKLKLETNSGYTRPTLFVGWGEGLGLFELGNAPEMYTAISRKVVGKDVHATIPKGNMGYDRYTVPDDCSCRTYFCCFPLALANTFSWPFVPIRSNFSEEQWTETTHNAFRDCRVHFFRQPFSK